LTLIITTYSINVEKKRSFKVSDLSPLELVEKIQSDSEKLEEKLKQDGHTSLAEMVRSQIITTFMTIELLAKQSYK